MLFLYLLLIGKLTKRKSCKDTNKSQLLQINFNVSFTNQKNSKAASALTYGFTVFYSITAHLSTTVD
jgi:hypothetical protein